MEDSIRIKQNLDTNFLKLVAIFSMLVDHVSKIYFPDNMVFAIFGRIAFPLFAYCSVVGCLYTHDIKKYLLRLGIFGVVSQPFFNMAFHPSWKQFWDEFFSLNIFFTLIAGVFVITGLRNIKKCWWLILVAFAMEWFIGLDYGSYGIIMMALFYLFRNKSWLSILVVFVWMCGYAVGDFIQIGSIGLDRQFFAVLALPFIYIHTNFQPKIHKYFFYMFYPAHLFFIFMTRMIFGV